MAAPSPSTVSLKLLIAPKSQKVLYAEAGKDFVDFLFNIMLLSVGTAIRFLGKQGTAGCVWNIYESIENLGSSYMLSEANKDILLKAQGFNFASYEPLLLPSIQPPAYTNLYRCSSSGGYANCRMYMANNPNSRWPKCNSLMNLSFTFVNQPSNVGYRFVKEAVTYMITDDLVAKPISTSSILTLLNKYNIKDVADLDEKVIAIGVNEGVKLLMASLRSETALTDVFLEKKAGHIFRHLPRVESRRYFQ